MRLLVLLCFFLGLLPAAVLAHDLYLAYQEAEQAHVQFGAKPINFTDVGWLWVQYNPESYDWVRSTIDPQVWKGMVDPILQQTALIVTTIPFLVFLAVLVLFRLFKDMPFIVRMRTAGRQKTARGGGIAIQGLEKQKKKINYKRK